MISPAIPVNTVAYSAKDSPNILDHLLFGVLIVDKLGVITYANDAACQLLRTKKKDIIGRISSDRQWKKIDRDGNLVSPDKLPLTIALQESRSVVGCECGLQFDNQIVWISVHAAPLYDKFGGLNGAVANFVNITEKKDTEDKLLQREQRLSSIANSQTSYLLRATLDGRFTYVNDACLVKYGYQENELLGRPFSMITDPDDVDSCVTLSRDCMKNPGESRSIQIRGINKQRDYFWTEWEFVGIVDSSGRVTEIQGVGRDVSDEVRTEGLLQDTSQMARVGGWELTSLTQNLSWTDETYRIHDLPPNTAVSLRKAIRFYHPDHQSTIKRAIKDLIAQGENFDLELKLVTQKGREVWVRTQGQREVSHGNFIRIYGVIQDITERKLAEERVLQSNEKLMKINSELDRFVYSASHDLRAPLTSIIGLINLSKMEDVPPVIREYLGLMKKSADKLDNFIQDLTNFSRNARTEIKHERIDFQEMVDTIFEQHKFMDEDKQVVLQSSIDQQVDFFSDGNRLQVMFSNLISNAVKYNNSRVDRALVEIEIVVDTKEANVRISDNGIGIGAEHLDRIFEMFYRATNERQGSGLGLYIVKETVDKLKGEVQVTSKQGVGTTFTFMIPNTPPSEEATAS
jgi:PAS domain S-box-containing protein